MVTVNGGRMRKRERESGRGELGVYVAGRVGVGAGADIVACRTYLAARITSSFAGRAR
jgi:hypothetical protein